jgi:hypothetical protein
MRRLGVQVAFSVRYMLFGLVFNDYFVFWTVSFINSAQYKHMLQAEGGFGARVLFVLCGMPTSN